MTSTLRDRTARLHVAPPPPPQEEVGERELLGRRVRPQLPDEPKKYEPLIELIGELRTLNDMRRLNVIGRAEFERLRRALLNRF
jgi:hypothetical protein